MSKSTEWWMTLFLFLVSSDICLSIQLYIESPNMLLLTLWKGIFICGSDCLFNSYWINSYTKMISLYELSNIWDPDNSCLWATINFRPYVRYLSIQSRVLDTVQFSEVCAGVCGYLACWLGVYLSDIISCTVADCLCPQRLAWMVSLPVIPINQTHKNHGWKIWWFVAMSEEGNFLRGIFIWHFCHSARHIWRA